MNKLIRQIRQAHYEQARGEKGFSQIILLGVITVLILAGVGGFLVFQEFQEKKMPSFEKTARQTEDATSLVEPTSSPVQAIQSVQPQRQQAPKKEEQTDAKMKQYRCEGTKTKFDYAPVNLDKTLGILPRGLMTGDHVTPVNHHYFQNFDNQEYDIEVYSPGKGYITDIGHMPNAEEGKDYHIIIKYTCTVWSYYIYVSNLPEKIKAYAPPIHGYNGVRIPVEAGELIGYYKRNLDFNLIDDEVTLPGFVVPEHYIVESYKRHIVPNTYEYFNEPTRSKLIEKSIRTIEPISGKIDYDVDGKLVGNWFREGTNGYGGTGKGGYWTGHLSFVYDYLDSERIVVSIAGYDEQDSRQFGVKGNSPDPAEISVQNSLIKYELVGYDYIKVGGGLWDRRSVAKIFKTEPADNVQGVVLVQMIENRKIKFETFPGKTGAEVNGFTDAAKIYER